MVQLLLNDKRLDPTERRNTALKDAIDIGHLEIAQCLLQDHRVLSTLDGFECVDIMGQCIRKGYDKILISLFQSPHLYSSANDNIFIKEAKERQKEEKRE